MDRDTFLYPRLLQALSNPALDTSRDEEWGTAQHSQRLSDLPVVIPWFFSHPSLNSRLRYSCNPGYKRKAGTSSLIQCILWNGSEPRWTDPTLRCIRNPSPASSQSPVPPAPDGSRPPEMVPTLDTSALGEGTTPLPIAPTDYAAGWADSQGNTNLPWGLFIHKGSFAFPMELFLLSDLLFSEAPPSIHPFPTFAAQNFLFSPLFQFPSSPWPLLLVSWEKTSLWETGAYFNFFKFKIPSGGCGRFIPWPMGMPLSGGRIQHPNFFLERIPNSIPPGVGRDLVMVSGVVLAPHGAILVEFLSHGLGDAPHPECPSHRTPGAAGHRNCGRLLLEEEEEEVSAKPQE
uniref:Uncharacterized protein n=1 Tax=Geospiza parvula TaxID=87175 RepID=A0A8C3NHK4_GEOPR